MLIRVISPDPHRPSQAHFCVSLWILTFFIVLSSLLSSSYQHFALLISFLFFFFSVFFFVTKMHSCENCENSFVSLRSARCVIFRALSIALLTLVRGWNRCDKNQLSTHTIFSTHNWIFFQLDKISSHRLRRRGKREKKNGSQLDRFERVRRAVWHNENHFRDWVESSSMRASASDTIHTVRFFTRGKLARPFRSDLCACLEKKKESHTGKSESRESESEWTRASGNPYFLA